MKKFSIFMCAIAMVGMIFTSCKGDDPVTPISDIVEDGFYIVGEATGFADLQASGVAVCQLANGTNEVTKSAREGMYEKYIVLQGGKEFKFIQKAGDKYNYFTATLEQKNLQTDGVDIEGGYWGKIASGEAAMKVTEDALYHIVLDLNQDGLLDAAGGAQVVIAPCKWGVRGAMNGWSYTEFQGEANEAGAKIWAWKNQEMGSDNAEFKFAHGNFWKINLDVAEQVKAEVSLGKDMVSGGENIVVAERGLYDITLTFKLAKGDIKNSFAFEAKKVGEIAVKDYSNVELEVVGSAVADQEGAVPDETWKWGNLFPLGKPVKSGDLYTWGPKKVKLLGGQEYKVRTKDAAAQGDIPAFDNGANIAVAADGEYDITVVVDATTGEMKVSDGSAPADPVNITVTGIVPQDWSNCNIYAWNGDGNLAGDWPGEALEIKDGKVTKTFNNVVPPINVIFNNGTAQTEDIKGISKDTEINISENLKQ